MSAITTHVLDTVLGKPAAGIAVRLEKQDGGGWIEVSTAVSRASACKTRRAIGLKFHAASPTPTAAAAISRQMRAGHLSAHICDRRLSQAQRPHQHLS